MSNADYGDYIGLLLNTPAQAESLLHSLQQAASGIDFYGNANKTEFIRFNQDGTISTLSGKPLK